VLQQQCKRSKKGVLPKVVDIGYE
jgi:transposase